MALRSIRLVKETRACQSLISKKRQVFQSESQGIELLTINYQHYSTGTKLTTPVEEAHRFMKDCFIAVGTPPEHADVVARTLVEADYRGHYSHGMNRLEMYIRDIQGGTTDGKVKPVIKKETVATAWVDGKNGLGAVIGARCMDIAIKKAKDVGIGFVVAKGANHFGIAGFYALQAINEGLIGLSFSNTSPFLTPTRAKKAALGTNPLSLGAPALEGDGFLIDMATTAVAMGKIELARRKNEKIPPGWALNDDGMVETDATIAYKAAKLMPLGGIEETSGYKGYGLGLLVEVFSGILAGSKYGPNVRKWGDATSVANLGQSFMAVNPEAFAPGFSDRLSDLISYIRCLEPANPEKPVLVHGDKEKAHMCEVDQHGGLQYVENQHHTIEKLAKELNVKPMVSK